MCFYVPYPQSTPATLLREQEKPVYCCLLQSLKVASHPPQPELE